MDKYPKINLTCTTCKRLNLFIYTMDSFLANCMDLDLINRWIIQDDGSSDEDIRIMKEKYPFLEIHRNVSKGQAHSLNSLFSKVDTEWFLHIEDDWLFVKKDNFIRKLFDIAFTNPKIKNVTLRNWVGNIVTDNNLIYNKHVYNPNKKISEKVRMESNCEWFGFTFNPSLHHLPTIKLLGRFDESMENKSRRWDREPAIKYMNMGYEVANLVNDTWIEHIGSGITVYTHPIT